MTRRRTRNSLYQLICNMFVCLLFLANSLPAFATATYIQDSDNENNAGANFPDNDMDVAVENGFGIHPIEFDINVTGPAPTNSATLVINAFDIDEEAGETNQVFFNGNLVGKLSGQDMANSSSTFDIPIGDVVPAGDNLVQVSLTGPGWSTNVDWGQLAIDGGEQVHAQITSFELTNYAESAGEIRLTLRSTMLFNTAGNYHYEIQVIDGSGNNVYQSTTAQAGPAFLTLTDGGPRYPVTDATGNYRLELLVFYDDGGFNRLQHYIPIEFLHVQNVGPSLEADPNNSTISSAQPSITANGSATTLITLQAVDLNNNVTQFSGQTVTLDSTAGTISGVTDQGDGTYTATLTAPTSSGSATITGTIDGVDVVDNAVVNFVPGPADEDQTLISSAASELVANGVASTTITVQTYDANNNALTTGGDLVVLNTSQGTLGPMSDLGDGRYQATLTAATSVTTATISGTLNALAIADTEDVDFIVGTPSALTTTITPNLTTLVADGLTQTDLTVQLYDATGNILILGGDTVTLNATSGTVSAVTDNLDGSYSATLQSSTNILTAQISGTLNSVAITNTANVSYVARPTVNTLLDNTTTPTITGTVSLFAGASLSVEVDGNIYPDGGGNLASAGSNWTLTIPPADALAEGSYSVTARVTDSAAQVSIDTTSSELTLDLTIPTLTFATLANPNSSNVPTYTVNGSCSEIGATIVLTITDTLAASEIAGGIPCVDDGLGNGEFSNTFDLSALEDGALSIEGLIIDDANNQSLTLTNVTKNACSPDNTVPHCDYDDDGVPNGIELAAGTSPNDNDSDNDTIPDDVEIGADTANPVDTDGDGTIDALDTDSDNDLIPDATEAGATPLVPRDTDNDTIEDFRDRDSDGDHIPDALEYAVTDVDPDSDTSPNYLDLDSDGDGLPDATENGIILHVDTDGDQIDDAVDFDLSQDSDRTDELGDGISDTAELLDSDGDGLYDLYDMDSDNDSMGDAVESNLNTALDGDADGIIDAFDADATGRPDANDDGVDDLVSPLDSDADGVANYLDLDSDNDTLTDVQEAPATDTTPEDAIVDNPSVQQNSVAVPQDTDSDGIPNFRDVESTNPLNNLVGPFDIAAHPDAATLDANNNGAIDTFVETDGDGIAHELDASRFRFGSDQDPDGDGIEFPDDLDQDNDGIPNAFESSGTRDSDGDGWADYEDLDSDNDGLTDILESGISVSDANNDGFIDSFTDSDNDGLDDTLLVTTSPRNSDDDANADFRDLDSDGDDLFDLYEIFAPGSFLRSLDQNDDGRLDNLSTSNGLPSTNYTPVDSDGDGDADYADPDSDNDGYDDGQEDGDFNNDGINDRTQQATDKLETQIQGAGAIDLPTLLVLLALVTLSLRNRLKHSASLLSIALLGLLILSPEKVLAESEKCGRYQNTVATRDNPQVRPEFKNCIYLGAGLGYSALKPEGTNSGWSTEDENDLSLSLHAGWHMTPHVFAELAFSQLGEAGLSNLSPVLDAEVDAAIEYQASSAMVGYLFRKPEKGLNPYLKLGATKISTSTNDSRLAVETKSDIQFAFGAGVHYQIKESPWFSRFEYSSYAKDAASFDFRIGRYFGFTSSTKARRKPASTHLRRMDRLYSTPVDPNRENADDDGDRVPNKLDRCPNTIEGAKVNAEGCCDEMDENNQCKILFKDDS